MNQLILTFYLLFSFMILLVAMSVKIFVRKDINIYTTDSGEIPPPKRSLFHNWLIAIFGLLFIFMPITRWIMLYSVCNLYAKMEQHKKANPELYNRSV